MRMIKINNLTKSFGRIFALSSVNLEVARGEFFGLLGPNGAGKSTLIDSVIGYHEPDQGSITIDGEMSAYTNMELRKKIGYVPQDLALFQELSAIQNLKIFGGFYDLPSHLLRERINKALKLVQLEAREKDIVKSFSGGMKRRLNIAASILHDPDLILCDEPTVGVDPQSRNAIFDMLKELNRQGKTIIYTTHYMEEAERLCSRLAIIDNGNIIAKGTLNELLSKAGEKGKLRIFKSGIHADQIRFLDKYGEIEEYEFWYELKPAQESGPYSELFTILEEHGISNEFIEIRRATLEDVFLNLTGRSLRD